MGDEVSRQELYAAIERGFTGVNARLDALNGKVYRHEADIAVLKDRGEQAKDGHARYAGWGGVLTGIVALLWQIITRK
jgi:hypothetical protein